MSVICLRMITRTFRLNPEYDKILNEETKKIGDILRGETMLQRGKHLDFDPITGFIEIVYSRYSNWFYVTYNVVNNKERIHLTHQMNHKWSTYLSSPYRR